MLHSIAVIYVRLILLYKVAMTINTRTVIEKLEIIFEWYNAQYVPNSTYRRTNWEQNGKIKIGTLIALTIV